MKKEFELKAVIPMEIVGTEEKAVDARTLFNWLGYDQTNFNRDFEKAINSANLNENEDWALLVHIDEQVSHGGHNKKDYALTSEAAKIIAMMCSREKGAEVRKYYLACEKVTKAAIKQSQAVIPERYTSASIFKMAEEYRLLEEAEAKANLKVEMVEKSKAGLKSQETRKRNCLDDAKDFFDVELDRDFRYVPLSSMKAVDYTVPISAVRTYIKKYNPNYKLGLERTWASVSLPRFVWQAIEELYNEGEL